MIDRIKELPIQWLRSSLLQRWHPTNICQPGKSCEETFLYLSLGQADPQCFSVAILSLLVFSLGLYIFPCLFFHLNPWAANYTFLTNLISAVSPFLFCMALFYVGFYSSFYQFSRFLSSLSWGYTSMLCASCVLDHRQPNCWEEGCRYDRLFWKKLLTLSYEDPSLLLSDHVAAREQRATTHTS